MFGREGYTRASIDTIAAEASVSTRTIYNHFGDKEHLFREVIQESATQVAEAQIELIRCHLDAIIDMERGLTAFGLVWATSTSEFAEHFALVRQIHAEVDHIPAATLQAWQEIGPLRVHRELVRRMQHLADRGLLTIDDAGQVANHLVSLISAEIVNRTYYGARPLPPTEVAGIVTAGIRTFLHGYAPPSP